MANIFARWDGYTLLMRRLDGIIDLDYTQLMEDWTEAIIEDNRAKLLSGQDMNGNPAPKLKYRTGIAVKTRFRPRENPLKGRTGSRKGYFGETRGRFKGKDVARGTKVLANNNLTTAAYKELTGPYGIPRGESSRRISNFGRLGVFHDGDRWIAACEWRDVLDVKGREWLSKTFKTFPINGVRPVGKEKCRKMLRAFVKDAFQGKAT